MSDKELQEARAEIARLKEADAERAKKDAERDAEIARMREAALLRDAQEFAIAQLRSVELPGVTRARLAESLAKNPPIKDGALDREAFGTAVTEAAKAEAAYLVAATGGAAIRGMGASEQPTLTEADATARLATAFTAIGLSKELAERAAAGR